MGKKRNVTKRKSYSPIRLNIVSFKPAKEKIKKIEESIKEFKKREGDRIKVTDDQRRLKQYIKLRKDLIKAKQEKGKLYYKQLSELKRFSEKSVERVASHVDSWGRQKAVSKPILKRTNVIVKIKEHEPAPYVSRYFKEKFEEDKRQFYFK